MSSSGTDPAPFSARLGNPPSPLPDVPVTAVFLALYFLFLLGNIILFVRNSNNGHKFWLSLVISVFCVFRLISTALRIAWAYDQGNAHLGIAEQAFLNAGVATLYTVNLIFAQRIMRARQPWFGWSRSLTAVVWTSIAITGTTVIIIIIAVAQSFLTHGLDTLRIDRDLQLYALTWFVFFALLPTLIILLALVLPRKSYIDKFGSGRFRWKLVVVTSASLILTLGASWRCGATFASPLVQPAQRPWYFSSACFYVFTLILEIIVLAIYLLTRVDQRFHIPDGASGPGSYSGGAAEEEKGPQWPEAIYLPVTQVHHSRNVNGPVLRQDFLQVDPRTGQYVLTNPQQQGSRTSMSSSMESRRGRWSRTSWERFSRRSHRSLHSQLSRPTPRRSQTNISLATPRRSQTNMSFASRPTPRRSQTTISMAGSEEPPPLPTNSAKGSISGGAGAGSVAPEALHARRSSSRVRDR